MLSCALPESYAVETSTTPDGSPCWSALGFTTCGRSDPGVYCTTLHRSDAAHGDALNQLPMCASVRGGVGLPETTGLFGRVRRQTPGQAGTIACVSGVDFWNPYWREVVAIHIASGFDHVVFGVPVPDTEIFFRHLETELADYVADGLVTVLASAYTNRSYGSGRRATYSTPGEYNWALYGHRASFFTSCLAYARAHGDGFAAVLDFDEVLMTRDGSSVTEMLTRTAMDPLPGFDHELAGRELQRTKELVQVEAAKSSGDLKRVRYHERLVKRWESNAADIKRVRAIHANAVLGRNPRNFSHVCQITLRDNAIAVPSVATQKLEPGSAPLLTLFPRAMFGAASSVNAYGKTLHNARRSLVSSHHSGCNCEPDPSTVPRGWYTGQAMFSDADTAAQRNVGTVSGYSDGGFSLMHFTSLRASRIEGLKKRLDAGIEVGNVSWMGSTGVASRAHADLLARQAKHKLAPLVPMLTHRLGEKATAYLAQCTRDVAYASETV